MRRTLHVGQLPSQTTLKRRRVELTEASAPANAGAPSRKPNPPVTPSGRNDTPISNANTSAAPRLSDSGSSRNSSDDDDDEAELLEEKQRLAKLQERHEGAAASISGVASYNSDVLFRRTVPQSSRNLSEKAKHLRHSNLQMSKDHKDFLMHYFR